MKLRSVHLVLATVIAIAFAGCNNGNIYAELEREVEIKDLSLPDGFTAFDIAKIGGVGGDYFAAAGKIWTVAADDLDPDDGAWDKHAIVDGPTDEAICTALVTSPFGAYTTLFGGFIDAAGNLGLYESDPNPTATAANWTVVSDPIIAGAQIALLKTEDDTVDDWLVAVTARHAAGKLFTFGIAGFDGTTWYEFDTSVRASPEDRKPFNDVIWSPTFARWLATGDTKLYMQVGSPAGDTFSEAYATGIEDDEVLMGLYDDGTNVYIASRSGAIYYSPSYGTEWERIAAPTISGTHPPLTRFTDGAVDAGIVLVGSDGFGYYLFDTSILTSTDPLPITRCSSSSTDDLHSDSVQKLYYDSLKDRVFACTSMDGLWRGEIQGDGEGSITWNEE